MTPARPAAAGPRQVGWSRHLWDYGRDIGAAVLLIWSLALPWNSSDKANSVVYVLLTVLLAVFSLGVLPLSRVLRTADGSPLRWPTLAIRSAMCAPYVVVVLIAVVRDLARSGPALGAAVVLGVLGVAIAVVPREAEIEGLASRSLIAHRYRLACASFGGVGAAAMVVTTVIASPPTEWFDTGRFFFLSVLPLLMLLGYFVFVFGVTAILIGTGHAAWQPSLAWLGVATTFVVVVSPGGSTESVRDGYYGFWLLMVGAGLAAAPLFGGRDGEKTEARFWALVVANAFRLIVIGMSIVLAIFVLLLVQISQYGGSPTGVYIWLMISVAATIAAAAVGSSQLRADPRRGRAVALISVGVIVGLRVVDLAVAGADSLGFGSTGPLLILVGACGVIVYALLVPTPMRALYGLPPLGTPPQPAGAGVAAYPGAPVYPDPMNPPTGPSATMNPVQPMYPPTGPTATTNPAAMNPAQPMYPPMGPSATMNPATMNPATMNPATMNPATMNPVQPMNPGPQWPASGGPTPGSPNPDLETTVLLTGGSPAASLPDAWPTEMIRPGSGPSLMKDSETGPGAAPSDAEARAAADPATSGQDLMTIAGSRPDLRPTIALNPATYPALLDWLRGLGDPDVDAALARRPS